MNAKNHDQLAALITRDKGVLLVAWREQVRQLPSAKHLDIPTLNDHIPNFLDELARAFRIASDETIPEALLEGSPPAHGLQRHEDGYDIVEVLAEYNILRGCIHDLAEQHDFSLKGKAFRILNRVFDEAISLAVQTFATGQALEVQRRRDEYLAFVAHDLRTPLSAISLAARVLELASSNLGAGLHTARMLKTLHRNVQQLERLVDNVLKESAHVNADAGVKVERREFDLWPLLESLIQALTPVADTAATKLINAVPEDLVVYADASLLRRVFQNLIANAIKYAPHGEVIIEGRATDDHGAVECAVRDNGAGIPSDRLEVIFNQLETDPDKEGGIGLGLAIVKTFVEAHGGSVTVESKGGIGSAFQFSLPGRQQKT